SQEESHFGKEYRHPEQEYRPPEQEYRHPEQEYRHPELVEGSQEESHFGKEYRHPEQEYRPPELVEGSQSQEILRLRSRCAQYDDGLDAGKSSLSVKGATEGKSRTLIVLDPPRSGCDKSVIEAVNACGAENIIYVSCNPSTLARDLTLLTSYAPVTITPFDMFPQCAHVESVICLEKSKQES
ncbi:MAG: hypothetical protein IJX05_04650, partial [Clostridia bacterium]|nr:hypothetical protein [Clostridia bacterium]